MMTGSSAPIGIAGLAAAPRPSTSAARSLALRLHREFGVPCGILSAGSSAWKAWVEDDAGAGVAGPPRPPDAPGDRVSCERDVDEPRALWLSFPIPRPGAGEAWVGAALFRDADISPWAQGTLRGWGETVLKGLWAEAGSRSRPSDIAERLLRRLRVSDPPEQFQRRALAVLRDALDVEAVAWIPRSERDLIVTCGTIPGIEDADLRALAQDRGDSALRICNEPPGSPIRRFVVSSDSEGGWLLAANPVPDRPFAGEAPLLSTVTSLIATQRSNARIYGDLKELLFGVIRALTAAIDAKDPYTSGHSERVARIAVRIGRELGMSPHDQGDLYLMGLLHDIGKIGVEDRVLKKAGKLTPDEYEQIQAHVRIGVHILADLKKLHHLLPGVAYHHEAVDGSGYPSGLSGESIPLPARILAVADAFDAMSSTRPYRRRMSPAEIDAEFRKGVGVQWDERVVAALTACRPELDRIRQKGLGESLQQAIAETLGRS